MVCEVEGGFVVVVRGRVYDFGCVVWGGVCWGVCGGCCECVVVLIY